MGSWWRLEWVLHARREKHQHVGCDVTSARESECSASRNSGWSFGLCLSPRLACGWLEHPIGSFTQNAPGLLFHVGSAVETVRAQLARRWPESLWHADFPLRTARKLGGGGSSSQKMRAWTQLSERLRACVESREWSVPQGEAPSRLVTDTKTFQQQPCSCQFFMFVHSQDWFFNEILLLHDLGSFI